MSIESRMRARNADPAAPSPIEGPSPDNTHQFKVDSELLADISTVHLHQRIGILSMELAAVTRQKLSPDPEFDSIAAISWLMTSDVPARSATPRRARGVYLTGGADVAGWCKAVERRTELKAVRYFETEQELIDGFVDMVQRRNPGDSNKSFKVDMATKCFFSQTSSWVTRCSSRRGAT